jgi:hypothetical protein
VAPGEPRDIERAPPSWYRRQASRAMFRGNPALALDQLAALRATEPPSWTDRMLTLAALARADRWVEAAGEVQRLGALRDAAPELLIVEAVARRRSGERGAARALCRDLLARHAATRNPDRALWILRVCLLDPDGAGAGDSVAARLVEQVVDLRSFGTRESLAGALAVRAGRLEEAIGLLERAAVNGEATPHTTLFLAMAFARAHKMLDARKWLLKSDTFAWPGTTLFSQRAFRDAWFEAEAAILRAEVETLLDGR